MIATKMRVQQTRASPCEVNHDAKTRSAASELLRNTTAFLEPKRAHEGERRLLLGIQGSFGVRFASASG